MWQIDREREGKLIDRALLKKTLETFQEIGSMEAYDNDFESEMLADTAAYYSRKAASWIGENSFPEYMLKVCVSEDGFIKLMNPDRLDIYNIACVRTLQ